MLPLQGRSCIIEICWSRDWGGFLNLWGRHHVGGGGKVSIITEVEDNKEETYNNNDDIVIGAEGQQRDQGSIFENILFRVDFAHKSLLQKNLDSGDGFSLLWSLCNILS